MTESNFLLTAKTLFEKRLDALCSASQDPLEQPLIDAMRYSLLSSAKRLRPLLLLTVAHSYQATWQDFLDIACALEMIHTYSLIHDDLPCMDNDDLRRGKPTLHKVVPEWQALLTGDLLLTLAFEILAKSPSPHSLYIIRLFAKEAGSKGLIGGQLIDLQSTKKSIDYSTLTTMHRRKTASLFIAALCTGAKLASAPEKDLQTLHLLGEKLGLAYQLQDDLFDYTQTTQQLGKPALSDAINQKATAFTLLGEKKIKQTIAQLQTEISHLLTTLTVPTPELHHILHHILKSI